VSAEEREEAFVLKTLVTAASSRTGRLGLAAAAMTGAIGFYLAGVTGADAQAPLPVNPPVVPASLQDSSAPSVAPVPPPPMVGDAELHARLDGASTVFVAGERLHMSLLRQFYTRRGYEKVWATHQPQAEALMHAVSRAVEHGLEPEMFHAAVFRNLPSLSPIERELLLSDAFLSYADALARGALTLENRMDDEDLTPEPIDVSAALETALASPNPAAAIEALAPNTHNYLALRRALASYRAQAGKAEKGGDDAKLKHIVVNLERNRWLPRSIPADRVWVNTASANLVLYRDNRPTFTTRVVVGDIDKQTPELQSTISSLLFNPPWNVPYSIAKKEILPKLSAQPDYLQRHHMTMRHNGAIQQLPGPGSALGQLKFEMTNRFDVYLHDTPMKNLFSRDNRQQSHGCVRVQNPRELAAMLLQQPVDAVNKGIAAGTTNRRSLPAPVPVFLVYQTAFANPDGTIEYRPDSYERDEVIWQHLHPTRQAPVAERESAQRRS